MHFRVGGEQGLLAIIGVPAAFDSATGEPATYALSTLSRISFQGSYVLRRELRPEFTHGYQHWEVKDIDPVMSNAR